MNIARNVDREVDQRIDARFFIIERNRCLNRDAIHRNNRRGPVHDEQHADLFVPRVAGTQGQMHDVISDRRRVCGLAIGTDAGCCDIAGALKDLHGGTGHGINHGIAGCPGQFLRVESDRVILDPFLIIERTELIFQLRQVTNGLQFLTELVLPECCQTVARESEARNGVDERRRRRGGVKGTRRVRCRHDGLHTWRGRTIVELGLRQRPIGCDRFQRQVRHRVPLEAKTDAVGLADAGLLRRANDRARSSVGLKRIDRREHVGNRVGGERAISCQGGRGRGGVRRRCWKTGARRDQLQI